MQTEEFKRVCIFKLLWIFWIDLCFCWRIVFQFDAHNLRPDEQAAAKEVANTVGQHREFQGVRVRACTRVCVRVDFSPIFL